MKTIKKYLAQHAEREIPRGLYLSTFFPKKETRYHHCVAIPLYGEADWIKEGLPSLQFAAEIASKKDPHTSSLKTLLIAIINRHELSEETVEIDNERTIHFLKNFPEHLFPDSPIYGLYEISPHLDILLMNHNQEPYLFYSKEGVGKARKLGMDMALALYAEGYLTTDYFHTTDGDAIVNSDYFLIEEKAKASVLLHPYIHIGNYEQSEALTIYEHSLRYYVGGLQYAQSPYAHESLGSTIAITPECYAAVRGFPKRNAAEDFYLLNKAVKVGSLYQSQSGLVKLTGRKSNRVPFGTGVGTDKFWQKIRANEPITFYSPLSFQILKNLIEVVQLWSLSAEENTDRASITLAIRGEITAIDLKVFESLLTSLSFFEILETAKHQRKTPEAILKHIHESWDGFKTLKFIHGLRENFLPEVEWQTALANFADLTTSHKLKSTG